MTVKPEEMAEIAKQFIGRETELTPADYPVEYEPIRRWCQMVDDDNPLFINPAYARQTPYGEVVCPPFALSIFGAPSPGYFPTPPPADNVLEAIPTTPGSSVLFLGSDWEFYKTVKVGDHMSVKSRLAEYYIKSVRFDPKARWIRIERIYFNQKGEKVAVNSMHHALRRSPEEVKEAGDA